ncbi:MAG: hypothetical protein IH830_11745 [Planctomycetes bacterium]|nr:hypothetical protein [Planctomycetota bacterium]
MNSRNATAYRHRGAVIIWVAISLTMLCGFAALAIDMGYLFVLKHQTQTTSDAAALAAVSQLPDPAKVLSVAVEYAGKNMPPADHGTVLTPSDLVMGGWDYDTRTFTPAADPPNAVKVTTRRAESNGNPAPLFFANLMGLRQSDVVSAAVATMQRSAAGAGIIVLCPDCECSLRFSGNTGLTLATTPDYDGEAAIQVNSDDDCATCGSGNALTVTADAIFIVGDACWSGNPTINADIYPNSLPMPDPLAGLPDPPWGAPDLGFIENIPGVTTYQPGWYSGGIRITASDTTVVFDPGIYVLDGEGLYVNGGNLTALGVHFYVIGTGRVFLGGNGFITITPIDDLTSPYDGISIFEARDNTNTSTIIGSSNMVLDGTYYFPVAPLELGGTGISFGNQLIAWTYWVHGTGVFTINYDGRNQVPAVVRYRLVD